LQHSVDSHRIQVTLQNGTSQYIPVGRTAGDALEMLGALTSDVLAAKANGTLIDLDTHLTEDAVLEAVTFESPEGQEVYRHSSTHIMAQAVKELFPTAQLAIGPAI
jgi:threonyl-tRNA synthetase